MRYHQLVAEMINTNRQHLTVTLETARELPYKVFPFPALQDAILHLIPWWVVSFRGLAFAAGHTKMDAAKSPVIVSSQLLRPAREVDPVKYELTAFDRMMRYALYQRRVLFYRAPACKDDEAFAATVKMLKESLAEALVAFYPLAGRMRAGDGATDPVLELDCTDLSVRFSKATTEAVLDELGDFEPSEFCDSLCEMGCSPTYPWDPQVPLLFVQVTRFACGGISVGIAFSHQTCDGVSAWHFMNSWSEIARTGNLTVLPEVTYAYKEWKLSDEKLKEYGEAAGFKFKRDMERLLDSRVPSSAPVKLKYDKPEKLCVKTYKLDKSTIEKLKSEAAAESTGFKKFSTYEILCAQFWKKVSIARGLPESDHSSFLVLMNSRGKLRSLSKSYFGNAISSLLVTASVGELKCNGISYAAKILHEAIAGFDADKAEGFVAFMDRCVADPEFITALDMKPGGFMMVVSSPRHPVYECDFGFGRPVGVTFGTNDLDEGKLYLFPSAQGDGGVDVTVVLQPEGLERLQ